MGTETTVLPRVWLKPAALKLGHDGRWHVGPVTFNCVIMGLETEANGRVAIVDGTWPIFSIARRDNVKVFAHVR